MKGNEEFSLKKVLSEPNVEVVFYQKVFLDFSPLLTWNIYPKSSALSHSCTDQQKSGYMKWILSFVDNIEPVAKWVSPVFSVMSNFAKEEAQNIQCFYAVLGGTAFNGIVEELKKVTTRVAHVLPVSDDGGSTAEIVRVLGG